MHAAFLNPPSGLDSQTMAGLVDKAYATLMSELSGQPGHKLGADLIIPLCLASGSREPVKFLCRQLGGSYVPLPAPEARNLGLLKGLAEAIREHGEFVGETAAGIADGDVPGELLARIEKEGYEAIEATLSLMSLARDSHERKYGR
jgi:hypothetical protein